MTVGALDSDREAAERLRDRFRGLLLGLALGDAVGASVQHRRPGTFSRVADLLGGGPYDLPRGAWSDDTATALLCADSLISCGGLEPEDLWSRWKSWRLDGVGSATGQCLGISAPMAAALSRPPGLANSTAEDGEPLPRVAVAAAFAFGDPLLITPLAEAISCLTHPSPRVADASRVYAGLVAEVMEGKDKDRLFPSHPTMASALGSSLPSEAQRLVAGAWRRLEDPVAQGANQGDVLGMLSLTCAVIATTATYRDAVLKAVNAGGHADIAGATVGALAGAMYGVTGLPQTWLSALTRKEEIEALADQLAVASLTRLLDDSRPVIR